MVDVKYGVQHQAKDGDIYQGVYVQHRLGDLTYDTFVGHRVEEGGINYYDGALVGSWVYSGDIELSASEELL